jgi:hypothetical protein
MLHLQRVRHTCFSDGRIILLYLELQVLANTILKLVRFFLYLFRVETWMMKESSYENLDLMLSMQVILKPHTIF